MYCKALNKSFDDKNKLFKELKANEEKLIFTKKSCKYESFERGQYAFSQLIKNKDFAQKSNFDFEDGYYYPVINTTRYYDSHEDVHFDGLWKKTIKDQTGKIAYVSNHKTDIDNIIVWPENVKVFTQLIDWAMVGKDYLGQTEALIFKIAEADIQKENVIKAFKEKRNIQGSISMMYYKITMAIDSNLEEYKANKAYYDSRINLIANKEIPQDKGYFFGVDEARIFGEGSLVYRGSNDATEIIYPKSNIAICPHCKYDFDYLSIKESGMGYVKCPNCDGIVTQENVKSEPLQSTQKTIKEPSYEDTLKYLVQNY